MAFELDTVVHRMIELFLEGETLPKSRKEPEMTKATATQTKSLNACTCGCGFPVKGFYKQGHDAKHVSTLLRQIVIGQLDSAVAYDVLPSEALRTKLRNAITNAAKKEAKANKTSKEVKIGRWWYPVVSVAVGTNEVYVAYTAKDGTVKETVTTEDKLR